VFLEVHIPKELVNWQRKQGKQIKNPTRKIDVWGTPASSEARSKKFPLNLPVTRQIEQGGIHK
jgi:hypothetical protein